MYLNISLIEPYLSLEIITMVDQKCYYHGSPANIAGLRALWRDILVSESSVSHLAGGFLCFTGQTKKQTLQSQSFNNLSVHYKRFFLSKGLWSEKGTDFQTLSKLNSTLDRTPVSSAHLQIKIFFLPFTPSDTSYFCPCPWIFLRCEFCSIRNQLFSRRLIWSSLISRRFLSCWWAQWHCHHLPSRRKMGASSHSDVCVF